MILVDKWQVHRRLINPAFNIYQLKQLLPIFNKKSQIFVRNLQIEVGKTTTFDLCDYILPTNIDKICRKLYTKKFFFLYIVIQFYPLFIDTLMGYDIGKKSNSEYKSFADYTKK